MWGKLKGIVGKTHKKHSRWKRLELWNEEEGFMCLSEETSLHVCVYHMCVKGTKTSAKEVGQGGEKRGIYVMREK